MREPFWAARVPLVRWNAPDTHSHTWDLADVCETGLPGEPPPSLPPQLRGESNPQLEQTIRGDAVPEPFLVDSRSSS